MFVVALYVTMNNKVWYTDSSACKHMIGNQRWFLNYKNLPFSPKVYLRNDTRVAIKEKNKISFEFPINIWKDINDILHVQGLAKNLLLISKIID